MLFVGWVVFSFLLMKILRFEVLLALALRALRFVTAGWGEPGRCKQGGIHAVGVSLVVGKPGPKPVPDHVPHHTVEGQGCTFKAGESGTFMLPRLRGFFLGYLHTHMPLDTVLSGTIHWKDTCGTDGSEAAAGALSTQPVRSLLVCRV